jgi:hypothetical protein
MTRGRSARYRYRPACGDVHVAVPPTLVELPPTPIEPESPASQIDPPVVTVTVLDAPVAVDRFRNGIELSVAGFAGVRDGEIAAVADGVLAVVFAD